MPVIKLLVDGGEMKPGPAVSQQLGPMGINIGELISRVNQATSQFKGMKVPAILDVNPKTKQVKIEVSSPPTAELLKREFGLEKAANDKKKETVANASIEDIIKIAKIKHSSMLSRDLKATVKSIAGTCAAMGILAESKSGKDIQGDINNRVFDKEIAGEKTETSAEKRAELKNFLEQVIKKQEEARKAEEAAKVEAEAAKAAAAAAEGKIAAEGAEAPEAAEAPEQAAKTEEKEPEEKKK